ncbi:aldehyde dehydrogenase family protein [Herbaspirillum rubrisubalbicans]|uniref:aldehyde dehydrogenase family protein n=1 Tax=Herbaspirillum rubrisubalbicans TaxID=80842 RepID=UPI0034508AA8
MAHAWWMRNSSARCCPSSAIARWTKPSPMPTGSMWGWEHRCGAVMPSVQRRWPHACRAGTVWVNQHGMVHPMVPFGGNKRSGWGLEFGNEGLKGVTQPQVISLKK